MTLDHIQLFRDIGACRSISKAAKMNGISQSAASQHLIEIERAWHVELVDRKTRPLTLTPAGRAYYEFCRETVRSYQQLRADLDQERDRVQGVCRVASIYSVGLSELVYLEEQFRARYPEAELRVEYLRPERVYEEVLQDRADLGLVSYPETSRELTVIPWRQEPMVVVTNPNHPFAGIDRIRVEDLEGQDFVGFDDDLPVSRDIKRFLREAGVEVRQVMHFDNIQSMKEAVALGRGLSILPEPMLRVDIEQGRLRATRLDDPRLVRPLGILHQRRKRFNRATESFLDLLRL